VTTWWNTTPGQAVRRLRPRVCTTWEPRTETVLNVLKYRSCRIYGSGSLVVDLSVDTAAVATTLLVVSLWKTLGEQRNPLFWKCAARARELNQELIAVTSVTFQEIDLCQP
jgi:hypothetical protein